MIFLSPKASSNKEPTFIQEDDEILEMILQWIKLLYMVSKFSSFLFSFLLFFLFVFLFFLLLTSVGMKDKRE